MKEELETLPERLRAVVELRLEGYTYQEISDKLGMALVTAHQLVTESVRLLRKRLEE